FEPGSSGPKPDRLDQAAPWPLTVQALSSFFKCIAASGCSNSIQKLFITAAFCSFKGVFDFNGRDT
ncbi:MAG: hypothetical protein AABX69_00305, partial [Nanoarchaeota archaeon]